MKTKLTLAAALILLIFSATSVFAWGNGKRGGDCDRRGGGMNYEQFEDRMENRLDKMAVILDLSDEQKGKIEDLGEKHWKERQELREKMQAGRDEMRQFRGQKDVDAEAFRAKARQQADLKADMMAQRQEHRAAVMAVLTPEQQAKAEELREMRGERRGKRGFGPGNCDGDCDRRGKRCDNNNYGRRDCRGNS